MTHERGASRGPASTQKRIEANSVFWLSHSVDCKPSFGPQSQSLSTWITVTLSDNNLLVKASQEKLSLSRPPTTPSHFLAVKTHFSVWNSTQKTTVDNSMCLTNQLNRKTTTRGWGGWGGGDLTRLHTCTTDYTCSF